MDELSGGLLLNTGISSNIDMRLKSFPYPPYVDDSFIFVLMTQLPFIVMLSYIVIVPVICKDIVLEKEKKLKVCNYKSKLFTLVSKNVFLWIPVKG
jgi:hypothetical protein